MTLKSLQKKRALQFLAQTTGDDRDDAEERGAGRPPGRQTFERIVGNVVQPGNEGANGANDNPNAEDRDRHQQKAQSNLAKGGTAPTPQKPCALAVRALQHNHEYDQDDAVGYGEHEDERQRQLLPRSRSDTEGAENPRNKKLRGQARAEDHLENSAESLLPCGQWALQRCQLEWRTGFEFRGCVFSHWTFSLRHAAEPCKNDRVLEFESTRGNRNVPNTQRTSPHRRGRTEYESRADRTCAYMGVHCGLRRRR